MFGPTQLIVGEFGYAVGGWRVDRHPRFLADLTGDGRPDVVGFADEGVRVSFNDGNGSFGPPRRILANFGADFWGGGPRLLADLRTRGRADIVGFGASGVWVSFNNGDGTFEAPQRIVTNFGLAAGGWRTGRHPRCLADLTGDGRADIIGFGDAGVSVALNNGDGTFGDPHLVIEDFGYDAGGWRVDRHPRMLADLTGDGRADVIGFADDGVWVAINNGDGTFQAPRRAVGNFGYEAGGWRLERHPRFLADLTRPGRADIVGFADDGVWVALNNGDGTFREPRRVVENFGYEAGGWRVDRHPRFLADLVRPGRADIVGFGDAGVSVALNNGDGTFGDVQLVLPNFGYDAGRWRVERHPRFVADLNGDRRADIVGFGDEGVSIALNDVVPFQEPRRVVTDFGYDAGGWRVDRHPRFLADLVRPGRADIVGFGDSGVSVALNNGDATFGPPHLVVANFGYVAGRWRVDRHPRFLADLTGTGLADIVGFGNAGVSVALNNGDGTFGEPGLVVREFGYVAGGWRVERHPRFLADLRTRGRADIVGFADDGVWVAFNNGDGSFGDPRRVLENFGYLAGGWHVDRHPRFLADLTGDGLADIVGFGNAGVLVALNNGDGTFGEPHLVVANFGHDAGNWRVDRHPRFLADLTGDGRADIIGFGDAGVSVALNNGDGTFADPRLVVAHFGYGDPALIENYRGHDAWRVSRHPRFLAESSQRGRADIVGFGYDGVTVALNVGDGSFRGPLRVGTQFGYDQGWRVDRHPRFLADLTGDGRADIIGFGDDGVWVALNEGL